MGGRIYSLMLSVTAMIIHLNGFCQPTNKPAAASVQVDNPFATVAEVPVYPANPQVNYVRTKEALGPITDPSTFETSDYSHVKETTQYIDGLGRPIQTVIRQATTGTAPKDVVMPLTYDEFGRETFKYLPYVQSTGTNQSDGTFKFDPFTSQQSYYSTSALNKNSGLANEQVYYGKTVYEASPLNRPIKTFAPGNSWAGSEGSTDEHNIKLDYLVNEEGEDVRIWNVTNNALTYLGDDITTNIPTSTGYYEYDPAQLYKNVTTDEQGKQIIEYKDKEGQVVLKKVQIDNTPSISYTGWLCTIYVYDDFNQLRFVIPPKAVEWLSQNGWDFSASGGDQVITELCFRYEYDARKRMIAKKVPGAGWVYMIYDKRDRLVYTQDANMKAHDQWMVNLYDGLNRLNMTGMITYSGTRDQLQLNLDDNFSNTTGNISVTSNLQAIPIDRVLIKKITGTQLFTASHSITLNPGTIIESGTVFTAEITLLPLTSTENVEVFNNPIPTTSNFIPLTINYYDNYDFTNQTYNTTNNSKLDAGQGEFENAHPEALPSTASSATNGLLTGTKVRVLENPADLSQGALLQSVSFYDDKGRILQVQSGNYRAGTDIITNRYDFTGNVICNYLSHKNPFSQTFSTSVKTNMLYDHSGKLITVEKMINDAPATARVISLNEYSPIGELIYKDLGQKKNTDGTLSDEVENLSYEYNIRGWLNGINKNSMTKSGGMFNWFSMELNYDWGFDHNQFNGNISGERWRSRGDGQQRAYGFGYDNVNRLLYGDFSQGNLTTYADDLNIKFDVYMGDGVNPHSAYDANGNIMQMLQLGLKITSSAVIDNLSYNYTTNGNKLLNVTDAAPNNAQTKLGDFQDKTYTTADYSYDDNGNLKKDLNKGIGTSTADGIEYNYLNLSQTITVTNKGTITYTYDATGNKLKKVTVDNSVPNKTITTTTTYLGGFIYESKTILPADPNTPDYTDVLQFFSHEEGRVRPLSPEAGFAYDYFIKDHLGNVRMVLTDELNKTIYPPATLEGSTTTGALSMVNFEKQYYQIDDAHIVDKPSWTAANDYINNNGDPTPEQRYPSNHTVNGNDTTEKVYRLNATTNKTGLGFVAKVMAGDTIDIKGKSYYYTSQGQNFDNNNSTSLILTNLIESFLGVPNNPATAKGITASTIEDLNSGVSPINDFIRGLNNESSQVPKAYINYIFFDEQFKYAGGSASRIGNSGGVKDHWTEDQSILSKIEVPKNGYVYVYVSNESNIDVFFDNLQVIHTKGQLLEETHYYPFGLQMQGISSKAAGALSNKKLFNGNEIQNKEFSDGSGLELYDFNARTYDQQVGRFIQIDPTPEDGEQESLTPYHFSGNNPSTFNDPNGKCPWCWGAIIGAAVEYGTQVAGNLVQGKSLGESLTDVDGGSILIAASAGALTGGVSAFVPKSTAAKVVVEGVKIAIDASESAAKQYNETGSVSLKKTVTDVASNKIAGKLTENVKVNSSNAVKTAEKQLNRAERVAAGDATSSGRATTVKKLEAKVSSMNAANKRVQEVTSGATSNTLQAGADAVGNSSANNKKLVLPTFDPPQPAVDNTAVKKPFPNF